MDRNKEYENKAYEEARQMLNGTEVRLTRFNAGFWDSLSKQFNCLPAKFIERFADMLDWELIMRLFVIDENLLTEECLSKMDKYCWESISYHTYKPVPDKILERFGSRISKFVVSTSFQLTEEQATNFPHLLDWDNGTFYRWFSDDFLERNSEKISWRIVADRDVLSEYFILKHYDDLKPYIHKIVIDVNLTENVIQRIIDEVGINGVGGPYVPNIISLICSYQKLSDDFIRKNAQVLDNDAWRAIVRYQKLSESFIEEFMEKMDMELVFIYQKLSEAFIEKYKHLVDIIALARFHLFSDEYFKRNPDERKELYPVSSLLSNRKRIVEKTTDIIKGLGLYECHDDYFIAYKAIRSDRYSLYNFQYKYEKGGVYESTCDTTDDENSFGLNVGVKWFAEDYGGNSKLYRDDYIIVRCKVRYEDVGRVVHSGKKIRCFKIEILD